MAEGAGRSSGSRRRRSGAAPIQKRREGPNLEKVLFFFVLGLGPLVLGLWWLLRDKPVPPPTLPVSQLAAVKSTITQSEDSLELIVGWELSTVSPFGKADSMKVAVMLEQGDTLEEVQGPDQAADTLRLPLPKPGETAIGHSCVAAHYTGEPPEQNCTPWQYVRPMVTVDSGGRLAPQSIVIQPSGLQVDPDVEGACAQWQLTHSPDSVWIIVNRKAVPECTGPNEKPMVAQFCAFAVLPDGRRVKTANSTNNRYCDELFEEWIRERFS